VTLHLVLRLRGGMFHVSSGLSDIVSALSPSESGVEVTYGPQAKAIRDVNVEYRLPGMAKKEQKTLYCHPDAPSWLIARTMLMEVDPTLYQRLKADEIKALAPYTKYLSREALLRYTTTRSGLTFSERIYDS